MLSFFILLEHEFAWPAVLSGNFMLMAESTKTTGNDGEGDIQLAMSRIVLLFSAASEDLAKAANHKAAVVRA